MSTQFIPPTPGRIFGLTHTFEGKPVIRTPRLIKVGIGNPIGKDIHVWIATDGKWRVKVGKNETVCENRAAAEKAYRENWAKAPDRQYPGKLPYFTFTRVGKDGSSLVPDFEVIEAHGAMPTEIGIMFTDDSPWDALYRMWSATGLQCWGDGNNALRLCSLASTAEEKRLAEESKKAGQKWFPIVEGCANYGCKYPLPTMVNDKERRGPCGPHATLSFQLMAAPRLGGKACWHTTSKNSIVQIGSALEEYLRVTGGGDSRKGFLAGIPLVLTVRAKKVRHTDLTGKEQVSTAYVVGLEFRAEDALLMRKRMIEAGNEYREAMVGGAPMSRQIAAPADADIAVTETTVVEPEDDDEGLPPAAIMNEFQPDQVGPEADDEPPFDPDVKPTPAQQAQAATEQKSANLTDTLKKRSSRNRAATPSPATESAAGSAPEPAIAPAQAAEKPTEPQGGFDADGFQF